MKINVPTISCDHCKETIKAALLTLEGVESVDFEDKDVIVVGSVARTTVDFKLKDIGYPPAEIPGPMDCV